MNAAERKLRFDIAREMVQKIYDDYCHDQSKTREQCYEFCCFLQDMMNFAGKLDKEAKEG